MFKRWACFILIFVVILSSTAVYADVQSGPKVYYITVTEAGGRYQLDNVELAFKKDCMGKGMEPITFTVQFYAENGVPYIDIEPSVEEFSKKTMIKVEKGEVEFFDIATNQTVPIELENYVMQVTHFSRYILID